MIGFYNYSVILTYVGLSVSVFGISLAINGNIKLAMICLLTSGFCDMFDGKIARRKKNRTRQEKKFGIQIDSLCDLICFSVLPAFMGYCMGGNNVLKIFSAITIVLAAVIRLGYFNVIEDERQDNTEENRSNFIGLPVTTVAFILPVTYVASHYSSHNLSPTFFQLVLIVLSVLFLSKIKVRKPGIVGGVIMAIIGAALALNILMH